MTQKKIHSVVQRKHREKKVVFEFHNSSGQLAARYDVPNQSAVYLLVNELAQGMYHVSMKVDGKVVARKKMIVAG